MSKATIKHRLDQLEPNMNYVLEAVKRIDQLIETLPATALREHLDTLTREQGNLVTRIAEIQARLEAAETVLR